MRRAAPQARLPRQPVPAGDRPRGGLPACRRGCLAWTDDFRLIAESLEDDSQQRNAHRASGDDRDSGPDQDAALAFCVDTLGMEPPRAARTFVSSRAGRSGPRGSRRAWCSLAPTSFPTSPPSKPEGSTWTSNHCPWATSCGGAARRSPASLRSFACAIPPATRSLSSRRPDPGARTNGAQRRR